MTTEPRLEDTLAWTVLNDYERYLAVASPSLLAMFLYGADERASLAGTTLPEWRIYGPLQKPDFYLPIVARTGHPTMSIKWATALEMLHFSMAEAMAQLRDDIFTYVRQNGFDTETLLEPPDYYAAHYTNNFHSFLQVVTKRPGMWGLLDGPSLQCWLAGMNIGGDWLGLPPVAGLCEFIAKIENCSIECYGSPFAIYRVSSRVSGEVSYILQKGGIEPLETSADKT